jgi:hypothetical protein
MGSKGIGDVPPAGSYAYTYPSHVAIQFLVTHPALDSAQWQFIYRLWVGISSCTEAHTYWKLPTRDILILKYTLKDIVICSYIGA